MKKLNAVVLAAALALSSTLSVFAANAVPNTTTLTTNVPDAQYTLVIPADKVLDFGTTSVELERPTVINASGFAEGKNLKVTIDYTPFTCQETTTTIPITVIGTYCNPFASVGYDDPYDCKINNRDAIYFEGLSDTTVEKYAYDIQKGTSHQMTKFTITSKSSDWGKALGGDYTATITFSAEVVAEA